MALVIRVPESAGTLYERIQYPAGELQIRLTKVGIEALHAKDASVTVLCRQAHLHLMELALLSDAIFHIRPFIESTLILPYLPYGRADRRFCEGDCHGLKTFGEIVNNMHFHEVRTLDAHSFRAHSSVPRLKDVSARPFISRAIADICDRGGHPVVLLPDEGAKRYQLDGALQCSKKRDPTTGKLSGFQVPDLPEEHDVLIVDDICDGGGTFVGLAEEIFRAYEEWDSLGESIPGTEESRPKLYLYVTHGIFSKGLQPLFEHFERIYTTNSFLHTPENSKGVFESERNPGDVRHYWRGRGKLGIFDCEPELFGEAT